MIGMLENGLYNQRTESFFGSIDECRLPMKYLANLFSAGDELTILKVIKKLYAVRMHRRSSTVNDVPQQVAETILKEAELETETADAIYRLTSLPKVDDRFVIPPMYREVAINMLESTESFKGNQGFGFADTPERI
jgi:nitrate reductase beta subunit